MAVDFQKLWQDSENELRETRNALAELLVILHEDIPDGPDRFEAIVNVNKKLRRKLEDFARRTIFRKRPNKISTTVKGMTKQEALRILMKGHLISVPEEPAPDGHWWSVLTIAHVHRKFGISGNMKVIIFDTFDEAWEWFRQNRRLDRYTIYERLT